MLVDGKGYVYQYVKQTESEYMKLHQIWTGGTRWRYAHDSVGKSFPQFPRLSFEFWMVPFCIKTSKVLFYLSAIESSPAVIRHMIWIAGFYLSQTAFLPRSFQLNIAQLQIWLEIFIPSCCNESSFRNSENWSWTIQSSVNSYALQECVVETRITTIMGQCSIIAHFPKIGPQIWKYTRCMTDAGHMTGQLPLIHLLNHYQLLVWQSSDHYMLSTHFSSLSLTWLLTNYSIAKSRKTRNKYIILAFKNNHNYKQKHMIINTITVTFTTFMLFLSACVV